MTNYRIYKLDVDRRIVHPALILQRETDDEVLEAVRRSVCDYTVEIWDGARRVGTIQASCSEMSARHQ